MKIYNAHERVVEAPAEAFAPLLAALGGPHDVLWPSPQWAPMVLDRPLGVGADGGHGSIRYRVSAYAPGRRAEFTFTGRLGMVGTHTFEVVPLDPGRTLLRHVVDGEAHGALIVLWPALIRFAHDAVVEQLLDRAEAAVGVGPTRPTRAVGIAALVARLGAPRARATVVPRSSLLTAALPRVDFADAHAIARRPGMPSDPRVWVEAMFADPPTGVSALLRVRAALAGLLGAERDRRTVLEPITATADEVLLGSDGNELRIRASVLRESERVVFSSAVQAHNRRGRVYLALVRHVHPVIVRALLTGAAATLARRGPARATPVGG